MLKKSDILNAMKQYFGHSSFRDGQERIVERLLCGGDALCVMPTGSGKSICYQLPALMLEGITVVVSPLIALMKDQVASLIQSGVRAAYINSSLTPAQCRKALENMARGVYKIVYVAPERLLTDDFLRACSSLNIPLVAVDEAHCVSQWGQDFRPSYLKISEFLSLLPERPAVAAFTATATPEVRQDIKSMLGLNSPLEITTGFDRPNLYFGVSVTQNKDSSLLALLSERRGKSGIVYCMTRKNVEEVCSMLCLNGYDATRYHAGLSDEERRENQDDFVCDRKSIMVATNAFGMGIDKSNVSFVIHYGMPLNLESYYQEAGRAGRDGSRADCILLYAPRDYHMARFMIENSSADNPETDEETREALRQRDMERLKKMVFYCRTTDCLRGFILEYFGEKAVRECGNCSSCMTEYEVRDITYESRMIIECIKETHERFGALTVTDILLGRDNNRIVKYGLDTCFTYGKLSGTPESEIRRMIDELVMTGYLETSGEEYPVIQTTGCAKGICSGKVNVTLKVPKKRPAAAACKKKKPAAAPAENEELFERLRRLRKKLADIQSVPAYVVFSDSTLRSMCALLPANIDQFGEVQGVGAEKKERYGDIFVMEINSYLKENGG